MNQKKYTTENEIHMLGVYFFFALINTIMPLNKPRRFFKNV